MRKKYLPLLCLALLLFLGYSAQADAIAVEEDTIEPAATATVSVQPDDPYTHRVIITPDGAIDESKGELDKGYTKQYVPGLDTVDEGLRGEHEYGFRDIVTWVALIFTVIAVVVLWILHTLKQRKDPLRRWL